MGHSPCQQPGSTGSSRNPLPRRSLHTRWVPPVGRTASPWIICRFSRRFAVIRPRIARAALAGSRRLCGPSGSCSRGAPGGSGAGCASPPDPGCRRPGGAARGGPAAGAAPTAAPTATVAPPAPAGSGGGPWPPGGGRSPARGARDPAAAAGGARLTRQGGGGGGSSGGRTDGRTDIRTYGHSRLALAGGGSEGGRYAGCSRPGVRAPPTGGVERARPEPRRFRGRGDMGLTRGHGTHPGTRDSGTFRFPFVAARKRLRALPTPPAFPSGVFAAALARLLPSGRGAERVPAGKRCSAWACGSSGWIRLRTGGKELAGG